MIVRVRRRDGATLLLTQEGRAASTTEGAVLAARALRSLLTHLPPDSVPLITTALIDEFPWLDVLPDQDRAQFVTDFAAPSRPPRNSDNGRPSRRRSTNGATPPLFMPTSHLPGS